MGIDAAKFSAPAKLNLFLHIVGKRDDQYHNIQTLFQLLDWGDDIQLTTSAQKEDEISFQGPYAHQVPTNPQDNLIHRALVLMRQKCGVEEKLNIRIHKHIPVAAGLGGASSAVASLFLALNKHWRLNIPLPELYKWGLELGSDIPFFIYGRTALAEGRGERLTPFSLPSYHYLLVCPQLACSTGELFADPKLHLTSPTQNMERLTDDFWLQENWTNAFLPLVLEKYPLLRDLWIQLDESTPAKTGNRVFLSGSGGTLFVVYREHKDALVAYRLLTQRIKTSTAHIQLARGISSHPMRTKRAAQ